MKIVAIIFLFCLSFMAQAETDFGMDSQINDVLKNKSVKGVTEVVFLITLRYLMNIKSG